MLNPARMRERYIWSQQPCCLLVFQNPTFELYQAFRPILEQVANDYPDVPIWEVDVERDPVLSFQYGIDSTPTWMLRFGQTMKEVKIGVPPEDLLRQWLDRLQRYVPPQSAQAS